MVAGATAARRAGYAADVAILYGAFTFHLTGTIDEAIDREAGRYQVTIDGQGSGIANRIASSGVLREGRWAPVQATSWFKVAGRETRSAFAYDWERRLVDYHYRGETFLLRRLRVVDDVVRLPEGLHVDDVLSATLNYTDGLWAPAADGTLSTTVVRRHRPPREGADDVQPWYRAELVPFTLKITTDRETGKPAALFDMTRFSSWAREGEPARILFAADRRPESIASSLMLGTSVTVRMTTV